MYNGNYKGIPSPRIEPTIPVKSFPAAGAYAQFKREYASPVPQAPVTVFPEPPAAPFSPKPIPISTDTAVPDIPHEKEESPEKHEKPSEGAPLILRIKDSLSGFSKKSGTIIGNFAADDILLTALLFLFLTDKDINDDILPIVLIALILL